MPRRVTPAPSSRKDSRAQKLPSMLGVARCRTMVTWHAMTCSERTHAEGGPVVEEADSALRIDFDDTSVVVDGSTALYSNATKHQRFIVRHRQGTHVQSSLGEGAPAP